MPAESALLPIAIAMITFPMFWLGVVRLLAFCAGWPRLAEYASTTVPSSVERGISGKVGWVGYNHVLRVAKTQRGLFLAINPLFRFGHQPLLIPWTKIRSENFRWWGTGYVRLTIRSQKGEVRICLPERFAP